MIEANTQLVDKLRRFIEDIHLYQDYGQTHPVYQLIDKFYKCIIMSFNILAD